MVFYYTSNGKLFKHITVPKRQINHSILFKKLSSLRTKCIWVKTNMKVSTSGPSLIHIFDTIDLSPNSLIKNR